MNDVIKLINSYSVPVTLVNGVVTLLDSGASMPVWNKGFDAFIGYFPEAVPTNMTCKLSGVANQSVEGYVYTIPKLSLGVNNNIILLDVPVVIIDVKSKFEMILSYTVFHGCDINIEIGKINMFVSGKDRPIQCKTRKTEDNSRILKAYSYILK